MSSYCCMCVLILLYMCPHTTIYVSSCYVLILLYTCPHATIYGVAYTIYRISLVFSSVDKLRLGAVEGDIGYIA